VPPPQLVILDIPDSGAYYVYDGDHVDTEMIRTFIGLSLCLCPLTLLRCICCACFFFFFHVCVCVSRGLDARKR